MQVEHEMRTTLLPAAGLALALLGVPALAEGGDRMPAGGAFMSSYSNGPYAAPRDPAQPVRDRSFSGSGGPRGPAYSSYPDRRPVTRR